MKQGNILLIGGGLILLYLFLKKKQTVVQPGEQIKTLVAPGTIEQPVLVSPEQQVSEPVTNKIDNANYRVKYVAGVTHYI